MKLFDDLMEQTDSDTVIPGLALGVVKENWNKDYPGKIRVELVLGEDEKSVSGWLPVMTPYGGDEFGFFAIPEINSQVVVAFLMGNGDCPIVLGSVWNNKIKQPKEMANEKNTKKCLITKGGHKIILDGEEKKESISILTPGEMTINLEDENKTITIQDEKGENAVILNGKEGEITLMAKNKMTLTVNQKPMISLDGQAGGITLEGNQIKAEAKQSLGLKGQNTTLEGTSLGINGSSSLKVESSGITQVKGSMVKIN